MDKYKNYIYSIMNTYIQCLKINVSLDRMNLSGHRKDSDIFIEKINERCTLIKKNKKLNYYIYKFRYNNNYIQIYYKIIPNYKNPNERFYVQLLQPDCDTQIFIYKILKKLCFNNFYKQFNPSIRAVEVAHDFFGTEEELLELHDLFSQHLNLKHSRNGSAGWYKNTSYRGKNGNARKGYVGSRCYMKILADGTTVCRFEVQFNGRYLSEKKFTIEDLPLTPEHFNALSHFEMLDNFSDQGIRNLAQTVLRKKGKRYVARDKGHQFKLPMMEQWLRLEIFGAWYEDDYVPVPEQIDRVKGLVKKYGLAVNPKKYFMPLFDLAETVASLLDKQQYALPVSDSMDSAITTDGTLEVCDSTLVVNGNCCKPVTQDFGHALFAHPVPASPDPDGVPLAERPSRRYTQLAPHAFTDKSPQFPKAPIPSHEHLHRHESSAEPLALMPGTELSVFSSAGLTLLAMQYPPCAGSP